MTSSLFLIVSIFEKIEKAFWKVDQRKDCWKTRWLFVSEKLVSHTEQTLLDLITIVSSFGFVN